MTDTYGQWDAGTATQPAKPKNGMGIAALVFGILALLLIWAPVVGLVLGLLAIVFGVVGRGRVRKQQATNGGVALTGLILGVLTFLLNLLWSILFFIGALTFLNLGGGQVVQQYQDCLGQAQSAPSPAAVQQAVEQCNSQFQSQLPNFGGGGQ